MGLNTIGLADPAIIEGFTLMIAKYRDALAQRVDPWSAIVSGFTSTAELRVKFPIDLTALAGFREWIGDRKHDEGDIESFFVDSKPYERTIDVPVDLANTAAFAPYVNKVPKLIRAAQAHRNILISKLLKGGKTAKAWDGTNFFGADHPVDPRGVNSSAEWSNLFTGRPFNKTNFAFAKSIFRQMKAPDGVTSLGLQLTHVLAGSDMEESFDNLFKKVQIASDSLTPGTSPVASETNIYYGGAKPIIGAEVDANDEAGVWYALALNTESMPFETQMKDGGAPQIDILGERSEHAVKTNKMAFAGKLFGNSGYAIHASILRFEPT
jgi:phage major head subunit gpT-like protein